MPDEDRSERTVIQGGMGAIEDEGDAAGCAVLERLHAEPPYPQFEFACTAFTEGLKELLEPRGPVTIRRK